MACPRFGRLTLSLGMLAAAPPVANAGVEIYQNFDAGPVVCPAGDSGTVGITYQNYLNYEVTLRAVTAEPGTCEGYDFGSLSVGVLPAFDQVLTDSFAVNAPTATACDLTFWVDETGPVVGLGGDPIDADLLTAIPVRIDAADCVVNPPPISVYPPSPLMCSLGGGTLRPSPDTLSIYSAVAVDLTLAAADPSCAPFLFKSPVDGVYYPTLSFTTNPSIDSVSITLEPLLPGGFGTACAYVGTVDGVDVPFVLTSDPACAATSYIDQPPPFDLGNVSIDRPGNIKLTANAIADLFVANLRWQNADSLTFVEEIAVLPVTIEGVAEVPVVVPIGGPHTDTILVDNSDVAVVVTGFGFGPRSGTLAPINLGTADRMQAPLRAGVEFRSQQAVTHVELTAPDGTPTAVFAFDTSNAPFSECATNACDVNLQPGMNDGQLAIALTCDASRGAAGEDGADANLVVTSSSFGGVSPLVTVTVLLHCDFAGGGTDDGTTDDLGTDDGEPQSYYSCGIAAGGGSGLTLVSLATALVLRRRRRRAAAS